MIQHSQFLIVVGLIGIGIALILLFVGIAFIGLAAAEMRRWRGKF